MRSHSMGEWSEMLTSGRLKIFSQAWRIVLWIHVLTNRFVYSFIFPCTMKPLSEDPHQYMKPHTRVPQFSPRRAWRYVLWKRRGGRDNAKLSMQLLRDKFYLGMIKDQIICLFMDVFFFCTHNNSTLHQLLPFVALINDCQITRKYFVYLTVNKNRHRNEI